MATYARWRTPRAIRRDRESSVPRSAAVVTAALVAGVLLTRARIRRETGRPTLAARPALVTADDWDASSWDPEIHKEIDRRRRS